MTSGSAWPLQRDPSGGNVARVASLQAPLPPLQLGPRELVETWLRGRNANTLIAYRRDLADFAAFLGVATLDDAAAQLFARPHGEANALALTYRAHLIERGLAPATINRRLAALRSVVALARTLGMVGWHLEVEGLRSAAYRDTRGPGVEGVRAMLAAIERRGGPSAVRDRVIVRLLFDLALRRGEVAGLDLAHLDQERGQLLVLGKGRRERQGLTLPTPTREAIAAWLAVRGRDDGPLVWSARRMRLDGTTIWRVVGKAAREAGLGHVWPHALRHGGITAALDATGGDVRRVQRFSRHASVATVMVYDDARRDDAGDVAEAVAAQVSAPTAAGEPFSHAP